MSVLVISDGTVTTTLQAPGSLVELAPFVDPTSDHSRWRFDGHFISAKVLDFVLQHLLATTSSVSTDARFIDSQTMSFFLRRNRGHVKAEAAKQWLHADNRRRLVFPLWYANHWVAACVRHYAAIPKDLELVI